MPHSTKFSRLDFINVGDNGEVDYWCPPEETGDYSKDNAIGRRLARQFVTLTAPDEIPPMLGFISKAISAKDRFEGIEIGFIYELGATIARAKGISRYGEMRDAA